MGKSYAHPLLVLVCTTSVEESIRVAVSASKKVGGAVERNRAKRRLRAATEPFMSRLRPGTDLILFARLPVLQVKFEILLSVVDRLFSKAQILVDPETRSTQQVNAGLP
jgi:ribonuclease P protein component